MTRFKKALAILLAVVMVLTSTCMPVFAAGENKQKKEANDTNVFLIISSDQTEVELGDTVEFTVTVANKRTWEGFAQDGKVTVEAEGYTIATQELSFDMLWPGKEKEQKYSLLVPDDTTDDEIKITAQLQFGNAGLGHDYRAEVQIIVKINRPTYTVTFVGDGVDEETQCVKKNDTVRKPANPELEGHIFLDWLKDGEPYDFSAKVKGNISLTAKWGPDENGNGKDDTYETKYTVTYEDGADGEVFGDVEHTGLLEGTDTPKFTGTPTRDGYTFTGWEPEVAKKVSANAIYTAQWEKVQPKLTVTKTVNNPDQPKNPGDAVSYTITVENTGGVTINDIAVTDIPPADLVNLGGGALTWNIGSLAPDDDPVVINVYGLFIKDGTEGTEITNTATATGTAINGLEASDKGTAKFTVSGEPEETYAVSVNKVVYGENAPADAQFNFMVSVEYIGGGNTVYYEHLTAGESFTIANLHKEDKVTVQEINLPAGFTTDQDKRTVKIEGQNVEWTFINSYDASTIPAPDPDAGKEPVYTYNLSFNDNADGNLFIPPAQTYETTAPGHTFTIPGLSPTRPGYEFLGWSEDKDATEETYMPNGQITLFLRQEAILYAVWKPIPTYTVTINEKVEGENVPADAEFVVRITVESNGSKKVHFETIKADGSYVVEGLHEGDKVAVEEIKLPEGFSISKVDPKDPISITDKDENLTITNTYEAPDTPDPAEPGETLEHGEEYSYSVTYDTNGGEGSVEEGTAYGFTAEIPISESTPTLDGNVFVGWDADNDGIADYQPDDVLNFNFTMPIEDRNIELKAVWAEDANGNGKADDEEDKITVSFVDGQGETLKTVTGVLPREDKNYIDLYTGEEPTREGYTFADWGEGSLDDAGNVTYTAQWTKNAIAAEDLEVLFNLTIQCETEEDHGPIIYEGIAGTAVSTDDTHATASIDTEALQDCISRYNEGIGTDHQYNADAIPEVNLVLQENKWVRADAEAMAFAMAISNDETENDGTITLDVTVTVTCDSTSSGTDNEGTTPGTGNEGTTPGTGNEGTTPGTGNEGTNPGTGNEPSNPGTGDEGEGTNPGTSDNPTTPDTPEIPSGDDGDETNPGTPDDPVDIPDENPPQAETPADPENPADPEDEPSADIPDDDPPLSGEPDTTPADDPAEDNTNPPAEQTDPEDEPPMDIPDDDPPLSEEPTEDPVGQDDPEDDPPVDIPDENPPQGELPDVPGDEDADPAEDGNLDGEDGNYGGEGDYTELVDQNVPMDQAPQTGDTVSNVVWAGLLISAALGLAVVARKKKETI